VVKSAATANSGVSRGGLPRPAGPDREEVTVNRVRRTLAQNRPAPTTTNSWRRTLTMPRLLPHTIQLCIHCRQNPAGFWVSRNGDQTVRRPWCLSCCQDIDPACHHIRPFDLRYLR
jgi:hypothetical protein